MDIDSLNAVEREVWQQVEHLWRLAIEHDASSIEELIHPEYAGWVAGAESLHRKSEAVRSAVADTGTVVRHALSPLGVFVYDDVVAVVHYRYEADTGNTVVSGRWTETYLRRGDRWLLISVSGGPESHN